MSNRPKIASAEFRKARFEKFPGGGWLTYFQGVKYPIHGRPTDNDLYIAECIKKYVISWLRFLSQNKFLAFVILFGLKSRAHNWLKEFGRFSSAMMGEEVNPDDFCPFVREIYRSLVICGFPLTAAAGGCKILEEDKSYRYRGQDVLMVASKSQLILRPARETSRLLNIYFQREQRVHYQNLGWVIRFFLWTQPKIRQAISKWAEEADFSKFKMDKYDVWGACNSQEHFDYSYFGYSHQKMIEIEKIL